MTIQPLSRWHDGRMQLAARVGDTLVGLVDLYNYDPIHHRAEVGIVVEKACRQQGHGKAILLELEHYVQQHLLLHQIYCDILEENTISQHLFEQCGYTRCGRFEEWVIDSHDTCHTVLRYQKLL